MTPLFLSFETATRHGSAAIMRGREALGVWQGDGTAAQAVQLLPNIELLLSATNLTLSDLAFCSVALGPGSFTGLRVGLATAQGLADALDLPLVGVETLPALALAAGAAERSVALLASGRNEIFAQTFTVNDAGTVTALDALHHAPPLRVFEAMREWPSLVWAGDGDNFLHADTLHQFAAEHNLRWRVSVPDAPLAVSVGRLALEMWAAGAVSDNLTRALYARADAF